MPSRSVWNQFAYFNVNVNDDLSIPRYQQSHHVGFAQECSLLPGGTSGFSLNKFLNQSPKINYCGQLQFPSPKLDFTSAPEVTPPRCPDTRFQVRLQFANNGDDVVGNPIPVTFYRNNPEVPYSDTDSNPHLETIYLDVPPGGLLPGASLNQTVWVNGATGAFTLYTSLNDIGPFDAPSGSSLSNSAFYPLDELNGTIRECDNTPDVLATAITPSPFVVTAAVAQDNSQCAGAPNSDGIVTANVGGDTLSFVFRWYEGNTVKSTPDYLGATQKGLTGGSYLVVAEALAAGCSSDSEVVTVNDPGPIPVAVASVTQDQVSCDPASPTGALTAYVDEGGTNVTTGYDFFWYRGLNNVTPARPGYSGGATVDQLPAGSYRLIVTNQITQCSTVEDIVLPENITTPPLQVDNVVPVTACTSALADGEAEVSVNGNTTDYDFYWFSGSVSSPDTTSATVIFRGNHLQNVLSGQYTVFAANEATRCLSDPLLVTIDDNAVNPVVNTTVVAPQSACSPTPANGQLAASVDESASGGSSTETTGYTFQWYPGSVTLSTLPAASLPSGPVLSGASSGNYTVVVTRTATGCQTLEYRFLPEQIVYPVIDLGATLVHADNCTTPWGSSISVSADGGQTSADGYTFAWYDVTNTAPLAETSETLSNVPPGTYRVSVSRDATGCTTQNTAQYEILDEAPKPTVSLSGFNNRSCDASQPNGIIAATGFTKPVGAYTFTWFSGSPAGTPITTNVSANGDSIFNLAAGTYALQITDNATQCSSVAYASLFDAPAASPALDTVRTQRTTDCRPAFATGVVEFEIIGGARLLPFSSTQFRSYTYQLYSGSTTGTLIGTNNNGTFTGLPAGDYTATLTDDYTQCVSAPMTITIEEDPQITFSVTSTPPTSCVNPNGEINISVSSPSNNSAGDPGFSYSWFSINATTGVRLPVTIGAGIPPVSGSDNSFSSFRGNINSGYYEIEVTDNFTNCIETINVYLPVADPPELTVLNTTSATGCINTDGEVDISLIRLPTTLRPLDEYKVILYRGNNPTFIAGNQVAEWNPVDDTDNNHTFTNLSPDDYTLALQEDFSPFCYAAQANFTIDMDNPDPAISFITNADFSCNTNGTGSLIAQAVGGGDGDSNQSNFTFEWFVGSTTSTSLPITQVNDSLAFDLQEGNYTVRVTDNDGPGNGCSYTETFFLPKQYKTIAITSIATMPDSICSPPYTGTIGVETIQEDGAAVNLSDYTFELLDNTYTLLSSTGGGTDSDPFTGIEPGDYYVRATNQTTDCQTASALIRVENNAQAPGIVITEEQPDYTCNGRPATGILKATATGTFDNDIVQDHFTYTWFNGLNNTNLADALPTTNIDTDPSRAINLAAGDYTVLVQDTSGHSNLCEAMLTYTVTSVQLEVVLTVASDPQQQCDPADGTAYVTDTQEEYYFNGRQVINTSISDYSAYNLYNENLDSLTTSPTGQFTDLAEGTYRITTDSASNCSSSASLIEVDNISRNPIVSIQLIAPQYSKNADPASWTGALQGEV